MQLVKKICQDHNLQREGDAPAEPRHHPKRVISECSYRDSRAIRIIRRGDPAWSPWLRRSVALPICAVLITLTLGTDQAFASDYDVHIQALKNGTDAQRVAARQMLPREGIRAVPDLITLLQHEDQRTWRTARNILSDICHAVTVPGFEEERTEITDRLMALFSKDYALHVEVSALRLLAIVAPEGHDLKSIPLLGKIDRRYNKELRSAAIDAFVVMNTISAINMIASKGLERSTPEDQAEIIEAIRTMREQKPKRRVTGRGRGFGAYSTKKNGEWVDVHPDPKVKLAWMREYAYSGSPKYIKPFKEILSGAHGEEQTQAVDALLHLAESMMSSGGNWDVGIGVYEYFLTNVDSIIGKGAAIASLGRFGDETMLPLTIRTLQKYPELEAQALMGFDYMRGRASYEALLAAYPDASEQMQLGLLGVMGRKKDPIFLPLLLENATGDDPARRALGFEALVQSELAGGVDAICAYVESRPEDDRKFDIENLLAYADAMSHKNEKSAAGKAYLTLYRTTDNDEFREIAFHGVKEFPSPEAYKIILADIDMDNLSEVSIDTLIALNAMLDPAEHPAEVALLRTAMLDAARTPTHVQSILDMAHQQGVGSEVVAMMGFVTRWHLIGPFPWSSGEGFDANPVNAPQIDLNATYSVGDQQRTWKQHTTGQIVNAIGLLGQHGNVSLYAYANIQSVENTDAQIRLGSDDGVRVWLNGESVHENNIDRGMLLDQDIVPVKLKKGNNELLVQITQGGGGWGFMLRFTKMDGSPIPTGVKN